MIKSLEGLRGVAAVLVALFHLTVWAEWIPAIRHGYLFVDLFFVLSGFVIAGAYSNRLGTRHELLSFLIRRFGRLAPLLWFSTVLYVLAKNVLPLAKTMMISMGFGASLTNPEALSYVWPTPWEIFTTMTFTHALGTHDKTILNFVSWSISVEFWAYVLFAAVAASTARRLRTLVFAALSVVGFAVTIWASTGKHQCLASGSCLHLVYDYAFARCAFSFFLGALIWQYRGVGRLYAHAVQIGTLVTLLALFYAVDGVRWLAFVFPFAFGALVWSLASDDGPAAKVLSSRACLRLGQWSYSIYMLHPVLLLLVFFQVTQRFQSPLVAPFIVMAFLGGLLLCAGWTYRRIESPAREYFNRLAARYERVRAANVAPGGMPT